MISIDDVGEKLCIKLWNFQYIFELDILLKPFEPKYK